MEAWLYAILHIVFYITTGIALCGYMYLFTWQYCEGVGGDSFFALVMPTFGAAAALLFAWAIGMTISYDNIWITILGDAVAFVGTVVAAWVLAIRRYRCRELKSERPTFFIAIGYSLLVFIGSVLLILFV